VTTTASDRQAGKLFVVDCLLPSQIRHLGKLTYAAARKAVKISADECEARGGEYVAYDRASQASTLKVWLPLAQRGDAEAQTYVGEAYEKGYGLSPDNGAAAAWYLKAAEQGFPRAAIDLGNLFEQGLGLEKDPEMAKYWYRQASEASGVKPIASVNQSDTAKISIIEPVLGQRGIIVTPIEETDSDNPILVIGQIASASPIQEVTVNGQPAKVIGAVFRANSRPIDGSISIVSRSQGGQVSRMTFYIDPDMAPQRGKSGALGIPVL